MCAANDETVVPFKRLALVKFTRRRASGGRIGPSVKPSDPPARPRVRVMTGMPDDEKYPSYQKPLRHKGNDDYDDYADLN